MRKKAEIILTILIKITIWFLIFNMVGLFFPIVKKIEYYYYTLTILLIFLININNFIYLFKKNKSKEIKLFNIYYINCSKVFEICMLINNERIQSEESTYKNESSERHGINIGGSIKSKVADISPKISNETSNTKTYEYKELQKIINTNSTYLSEIIDVCKNLGDDKLKNGDLVKINNVKLEIVNKPEIAQINSMVAGVFKGNTISTNSDGQSLNLDINALTNILLKDYKYNLKGITNNSKEFYISIPIKAEKEFENNYSIYDLEIGEVNIIGIYRTNKYTYNETSTFGYLQKIGNMDNNDLIIGDELIKSNTKEGQKPKNSNEIKEECYYIDLIAIVQDLKIRGENNE
jgi:hypothetical protein